MRALMALLLVLAAGSLACGGTTKAQHTSPAADPNLPPAFLLGDASVPTRYQLSLAIDPASPGFTGEVRIAVELSTPLHTLWLHQKNLQIHAASFQREGRSIPLRAIASESDEELLGLVSTEELAAGPGTIHIKFEGELGSLQALFRQLQDDRWYAYSDFEATDARAAFPCYDEPRFKVPWRVEVLAPPASLAFSNAPELSREIQESGSTLFRFAETRPLPTYLVAVAVGPFEFIEGGTSKTPLRIIAPKGLPRLGRFVLDNTETWIRYLEEYLGMAMPFPKLDFIAVPVFGGAMENPGLVTFSSQILLTQSTDSTRQRRRAAGVTSHELAHMWFGNLITPAGWNDLWLNEAFATWLSDKVIANWEPERAREVLDIADKSTAYESDHAIGGRKVRQAMTNRQDVRDAFDAITYRKGGALLTMLEAWLGEDAMRAVVRSYLSAAKGGSVTGPDLVKAMGSARGDKQADKILRSFLNQPGIPQVQVRLRCDDAPVVELVQSRYIPIAEGAGASAAERAQRWTMPVCLRYPGDTGVVRECLLMNQEKLERRLRTTQCPKWILPNDAESGYYHYRLDEAGFGALAGAKLDPREELGLAHNLVAGLRAGNLSVTFVLDALGRFAPTGSIAMQQAIIPLLYDLEKSVVGKEERARFSARIRGWYQERLASLGLASRRGESEQDQQLRPVLIHLLVELGDDAELKKQALARIRSWLLRPDPMNMPLLDSLLQAAAAQVDTPLAREYLQLMESTKNGRHTAVLFGALHAFPHAALLEAALAESIPSRIDLPNLIPVLMRVMATPSLRPILMKTLFRERESLLSRKARDKRSKSEGKSDPARARAKEQAQRQENFELVAQLFSVLCDAKGKEEVRRFAAEEFDPTPLVETIDGCIAFKNSVTRLAP